MKQFHLNKIKFIFLVVFAQVVCNNKPTTNNMTDQKQTVEKYMDGFRSTDHANILSCLTDDVIWEMPGFFYHEGKKAFDKEIENPNADGNPDISITRFVEEKKLVTWLLAGLRRLRWACFLALMQAM